MDILGIGPLELFFIVLIALIVLGPRDMIKAGQTLGRMLRRFFISDTWRVMRQASDEIRTLPNRMMREAGIEEIQAEMKTPDIRKELDLSQIEKDIHKEMQVDMSDWTTPAFSDLGKQHPGSENQIAPPEASASPGPEESSAAPATSEHAEEQDAVEAGDGTPAGEPTEDPSSSTDKAS